MDIRDRGNLPAGPQVRSYPAQFEVRGLAGTKVELRGYASTTEKPYEMFDVFGAYTEVVRSGAFAKTLSEGADVAYLANHEGLTMARTSSGTLHLSEDSTGLLSVATVNTQRSDVRDLVTAIEDGDVDQMSFAFRVERQEWSPDFDQRALQELNLNRGDVSAVNFGANPNTAIGVQRSFRKRETAELMRALHDLGEKGLPPEYLQVLAQTVGRVDELPEPPAEPRGFGIDFLRAQLALETA